MITLFLSSLLVVNILIYNMWMISDLIFFKHTCLNNDNIICYRVYCDMLTSKYILVVGECISWKVFQFYPKSIWIGSFKFLRDILYLLILWNMVCWQQEQNHCETCACLKGIEVCQILRKHAGALPNRAGQFAQPFDTPVYPPPPSPPGLSPLAPEVCPSKWDAYAQGI